MYAEKNRVPPPGLDISAEVIHIGFPQISSEPFGQLNSNLINMEQPLDETMRQCKNGYVVSVKHGENFCHAQSEGHLKSNLIKSILWIRL